MLVFYGSSTLLRSFRSVNLSTLFPDKPPMQFTSIVSAHSFASNWQLSFLNQRKGDNGHRTFFLTNLLPRMCAGREDGICDRPHTRRTRVRPRTTTAKKFKSRRVVHAAERLTIPRSMSSVRYSLEAIFKSLTQTASRCTKPFIIIKQSSWSDWNTI